MAQPATSQSRLRHAPVLPDRRHDPVGAQDLRVASELLREEGQDEGAIRHEGGQLCVLEEAAEASGVGCGIRIRPVKAFAQRLRAASGKQIWMMGGGELIASFLDAGEIDEFDIHVIPVFIGDGIPLVAPRHRDVSLRLRSCKKYPDGVVRVRYEVAR
jgi:riboflavin biosynthesis pyrimidine reductase